MNRFLPRECVPMSRLAAALCCVALLAACDRNPPPAELVTEARAAISRNDYQTASIQLKNALQQDAGNAAARFELGRVHFKLGDMPSAIKELERALELNHDVGDVVPMLARALVDTGSYTDVISRFSSTKMPTPEAEADLKAALGYAFMATRNNEAAFKSFNEAIALNAQHTYANVGKARLSAVTQDLDGARRLLDNVLASDVADESAWFLDAELKGAKGDFEAALAAYRKVYEAKPDNVRARFIVISALANQEKLAEARTELAAFRKAVPKAPEILYLEGLVLIKERKFPEAREALNKLLAVAPNYMPALGLAALAEFELKAYTIAEQHGEKVLSAGADSLFIRKILIGTYLKTGRVAKAKQTLEPLLEKLPDNAEVQALAGQVFLAAGDTAAAENAFAASARLQPKDVAAQSRLGLSRLAAGDRSGGIAALENAVRLDIDDTRADVLLIVAHLRNRDADKALVAIDALERKKPDDPMSPNLRGTAYLLKKDSTNARASFSKALEMEPTFFPAASNLARMDLLDKNTEAAESRFRDVLAKSPEHPDALLALAGLKSRTTDGSPEAVKLLEKAVQSHPKLVAPHTALVQLHSARGDKEKALAAANDAALKLPEEPQILELLASAQAVAGQIDAAVLTREKLVARSPSSVQPLLALAATQMVAKRESEAIQNVRKALSLEPESLDVQNMLISIHMSRNALDDAIKVTKDIQKQKPKLALGYVMEGEVLARAGKFEAAAKPYREALSRERSAANVVKLHAVLSRSPSRAGEAQSVLDGWLKEKPDDSVVASYLAENALNQKRYDEASQRYEALLKRVPNDPLVLNNLAWLAAQRGDSKALAYAKQAYAAAPKSPAVLDTYGVILFDSGNAEEGLKMMRQAVVAAPNAHELRLNLAQRLVKAGMKADARKELEPLVALGSGYARAADVAELMKNL
ncbi:XrtA/PEP-CTERM system TPR-repeat protein PrsT [Methyloversatilis sp.]|uniref:XrtA/PEP-CTERM system TPR-repeat protein PrsT n=1 Tax=Methyloversatilis sp. TaxID=2569862 RepID=UPI0027B91EE1|nr:XrtA/PEP-CTERM system TPR-repeat protein PrsT [Methyloversatilis sp.]